MIISVVHSHKRTPHDEEGLHALRESLEKDLVYAGFVAIRDPLRPEVKDAIAECQWNGDLRFVENGEELLDYLLRRGKFRPRRQSGKAQAKPQNPRPSRSNRRRPCRRRRFVMP